MSEFICTSPIDGIELFSGHYATQDTIATVLQKARTAQKQWAQIPLAERLSILQNAITYLHDKKEQIGLEITRQMGRPIRFSPNELNGLKSRGETMLELASDALMDLTPAPKEGVDRFIRRVPVGVVAVLAPWNYPYLTSVNVIIPALAAGNSVILKHASQTPLVSLRWQEAFDEAGLAEGVFQHLFLSHEGTADLLSQKEINYAAFTGSVSGGQAITQALAQRLAGAGFAGAGLELGGKDPAFVRADADLAYAVTELADGAFFNSGQSCCGVERIYVADTLFDDFVPLFIAEAEKLKLGDPLSSDTTLGPMVSGQAADAVREQIGDALDKGAKAHLPLDTSQGSAYMLPQILTQVSHEMDVMCEESFGPVIGIMPVKDDDEAIRLMNDSAYGLTASIWSGDKAQAESIGNRLETGTVFLNRCDYLDPYLAWTGVKNSGRGCTLSRLGYESLTRPKSFHFKTI